MSLAEIHPDRKIIPQSKLDVEERQRYSLLPWRGQFNPHLIETLLDFYTPTSNCTLLDPFCGSGTSLVESARRKIAAVGTDINLAAYFMSQLSLFCNVEARERMSFFDESLLSNQKKFDKKLFDILSVNLFLAEKRLKSRMKSISSLLDIVLDLPYSEKEISVLNQDARSINLADDSVDLIITSPPYINVFNYHQNQREAIEDLGHDVLSIAKSEIGSNRANRGNRFITVIQYCIDISLSIHEMLRCSKPGTPIVLVVGRESRVKGEQFFNGRIVYDIFSEIFKSRISLYQERQFINRYGEVIFEDILHFKSSKNALNYSEIVVKARNIAIKHLTNVLIKSRRENTSDIDSAIKGAGRVDSTPIFRKGTNGTTT
jgi:DNA modification methylase